MGKRAQRGPNSSEIQNTYLINNCLNLTQNSTAKTRKIMTTDLDYSPNTLKRKNEDCTDLEAEIKRVALDDEDEDDTVVDSPGTMASEQEEEEPEEEIMLRMLCLVKQASLVVGPKGESISKLRDGTSTRVNVSTNLRGVPERVIFVKGNCENVAKAFGEISRVLNKSNNSNDGEEYEEESEKERIETTPLTLNLLISHSLMGSVIGKSGSQLREIEELSAAKLFASPNQLMMSNDRILNITGVPDAIHIATYYVSQSLLNCRKELKARKAIHYQPSQGYSALQSHNHNSSMGYNNKNFSHQTHHQYHPMDKYNVYRYNKPHRFPRSHNHLSSDNKMGVDIPFMMGEYKGIRADSVPALYTPANVANAPSFTPNSIIPNVRIVESVQQTNRFNAPISVVKQEVYIDENFVGNIIGKEGKHINSVKESTGCTIFIDNKVEGASERKLVIRGTYMASQAAIMLISNKIEMDRASTERNFNSQ